MSRVTLVFLCCASLLSCNNKNPTRVVKVPCGQKIISAGHYHANGLTWAARPMLRDEHPTTVTIYAGGTAALVELHESRCGR